MMETADSWRTVGIVMSDVLADRPTEVPLAENDCVVEQLAA
jgi:hypothetical protein